MRDDAGSPVELVVVDRQRPPDPTGSRVTVCRCGDAVLVEVSHGAALLTVAQVEALHTDLERAAAPIRAERQAAGR